MNPAVDITTGVARVRPTHKLRCGTARYDAGGGGINVARVATVLGTAATAVFPAGGATGELICELLSAAGVPHDRIPISATTRESFTVDEQETGLQYRFVLPGPALSDADQQRCLSRLASVAQGARFVVASGSLPPGTPPDFYQQVADLCRDLGTPLILDGSGAGLRHVRSGVFLLKPSISELRDYMDRDLSSETERWDAARGLIDRGVTDHVLVSLGARGAMLASADLSLRFEAPDIGLGSGVGAGDAMVAGVTVGLVRGWPLDRAVRLGMATGAAMLLTPGTAVCEFGHVQDLFAQIAEPTEPDLAIRTVGPRSPESVPPPRPRS
ncbi:phosphofructokinase [Mycobacterium sp. ACS4331]|nr:phosphofructokinase [Mycobacterium sp. ACS4331]